MSDSWPGPGWWRASDGKWYPPESHPDYEGPADAPPPAPPPPTPPAPTPPGPITARVRTSTANRVLLVVGLAVTVALVFLAVSQTTGSTEEELSPSAFTVPTEAVATTTTAGGGDTTTTSGTETTTTTGLDTTTTTTPADVGVLFHVPADIQPSCTTNPDSIAGTVIDAVDCVPEEDGAPTFATYLLFTDQASADEFYDTLVANHDVPIGDCGDSPPRDCTYTGGSHLDARYADFFLEESACRVWTDDEFPITAYACRDDGDIDLLDTWWADAGPA